MKKRIVLVGSGMTLIILAGYLLSIFLTSNDDLADININVKHLPVEAQAYGLVFTPVPGDAFDVFASFGVWFGEERGEPVHPFLLETPQDRLNVNLANETFSGDLVFLMKVFYNYEAAYFRVGTSTEYRKTFVLTVPSRSYLDIPFYLDSSFEVSDTASHLTVGLFLAPERHAFQDHGDLFFTPRWDVGQVLHFEINYGNEGRFVLPIPKNETVDHVYRLFGPFFVNQDFEPLTDGVVLNAPELLQVSPNEQIELAFVSNMHGAFTTFDEAGNPLDGPDVEEILIISMLDWQQIPMSGEPYMWVNIGEDSLYGQHGRFFIEAPSEPGFYEFVAFLVPNPTAPFSQETYFPLETSDRFTIQVIE
ncbi:MAG: hypothetical protein FWG67_10070 [Defluviitaleaceae bacterium]|nr:hypothetical protein [Defluviitaleaceae bacterium]